MTSCADLDMLFSLAGLADFHNFFHSLVFLLTFHRYGEEIWPKEPWLLPPCPRHCSSYSFLCLVSTISFPSARTLLSSIRAASFSLPSIPMKASHGNPVFLPAAEPQADVFQLALCSCPACLLWHSLCKCHLLFQLQVSFQAWRR